MLLGARQFFDSGAGGIPLPPGARRVEYIQFVNACIDTGLYWQLGDKVVIDFLDSSTASYQNVGAIWGYGENSYWQSGNNIVLLLNWYAANRLFIIYQNGEAYKRYNPTPDFSTQVLRIVIGENDIDMKCYNSSGVEYPRTSTQNVITRVTSGGTVALGKGKQNNGYIGDARPKIYHYEHWRGGKLIMKLIPIAIGQTGYLFDAVNGVTMTNIVAAGGGINVGPDA